MMFGVGDEMISEIKALRNENRKLREALAAMSFNYDCGYVPSSLSARSALSMMRDALSEDKD